MVPVPKKKELFSPSWWGGARAERGGTGVQLTRHSPAAPQAWLTEIHEYAQKDVVIMLLGNKVRAGSPFTPWFAVPCRTMLCRTMPCLPCPALAVPMAVEGWGSVGALPARAPCLHPPPGSAAFWAQPGPEGTPEVWGGCGDQCPRQPVGGSTRLRLLVRDAPGTGCCWIWDAYPVLDAPPDPR